MSEQKQHVLFVVNSYPPRLGGLENHVASLAARLVLDGHRASVVTLSTSPALAGVERGVTVTRLRGWLPVASVISFPAPGTARRIARSFHDAGVTAVSTHTRFFPMSFVGHRVARRLHVPHVHTEHGSAHVRGVSRVIGIAGRVVDLTMGRIILRGADAVLAVSEQVQAFVQRLAKVQSVLFYNAIEASSRPNQNVPPVTRFVFVGRIVPGKGWDDMLSATSFMREREPDFEFAVDILGSGPDLAELKARVTRLGLSDVVTVRGQVGQDEVFERLRGAVFVNPTRLAEGFQTTLLEALAAGSQVVTYPAPGVERLRVGGAPVRIAATRTVAELADLMAESLRSPLPMFPAEKMAQWTWPDRAAQYASILGDLRVEARRVTPRRRSGLAS